jgi:hypothetical protein
MGFDHCIANQFFIPLGMMYGADISFSHCLFHALLPATLGNIVGGGVLVGAVYWYVFDSMTSSIRLFDRIRPKMPSMTMRRVSWHPSSATTHQQPSRSTPSSSNAEEDCDEDDDDEESKVE